MAEPLHPEHLREVRLVVFDFDGVFTDNRGIVSEDGRESVICSRADGLGLAAIRRFGVDSLILSTEVNPVVSARARKLGVECQQGLGDGKGAALARLLEERQLDVRHVAYVGNDINDLECLRQVGVGICVADAFEAVRKVARFETVRPGGRGAVREVCDLIVEARESAAG